jgi:hypothetical protein
MWSLILLIEVIAVVILSNRLLSKAGCQKGDSLFWSIMAAVGSAIFWLKWVEPALHSLLVQSLSR